MKKEKPNYTQILLLARQWDLQTEPVETAEGLIFEGFGGKRLMRIAPLQEAAFCFFLQKILYQRGFARGLRFIPNKYGDAYGVWEEYGIYLTDYFGEHRFALESEYDLWRMAGVLAEFHNAAEGLEISFAPLQELGSPLEYAFWLTEQPPPPMTVHMLPVYERLCEQAQRGLEKCDGRAMQELCEQALQQRQVVHGRFRAEALCEYYGELLITDYGSASYGLPVWDLANMLNHGLHQLGRDRGIIRGALAEYEKNRRLSREEKAMLKLLLALPMEFIYAISDWQEQKITGEDFAEILLQEEKLLPLREGSLHI